MNLATCLVFFASGAAALIFETLWFRQTGLMLGNTVWASALVTASFMGGLALGNGFAIRRGWSLARPLRFFAGLELVVAFAGASLVFALPLLSERLAPLFAGLHAGALDAVRLGSAFTLLVLPASAMGATLPVLARSLGVRDANFGRVLGRLYGWNTLGAVAGTLCAEAILVPALGVRGTGLVAAALDLVAASGAWLLDRRGTPLPPAPPAAVALPPRTTRLGFAAFLAGGLLLALEVVWFRFLSLFVAATSATFALMLGVVLLGIAAGGFLGAAWLGRRPEDSRHASLIALAAGSAVVATYFFFDPGPPRVEHRLLVGWQETLRACLRLMLPTCLASGLLFTFLGKSLHGGTQEEARAAGLVTLSNTVGAMLGSLLAGFVLLPLLGMERSFFLLASGYGGVALLVVGGPAASRRPMRIAAWGLFAGALVLFPFGAMTGRYVGIVQSYWRTWSDTRVVAMREGLTETVFLLRQDFLGEPLAWRLFTNGMSMSSTDHVGRRYMGLFVWLPVAIHPDPRTALVISYGVGNTARALTATQSLTHIDVVDVSADVLRMSSLIWPLPGDDPLRDPRVRANVEDGRFFLLTDKRRYDIITGEPPPPKSTGIVNLYSREYFRLLRERLAEGGIATYWLPVLHLSPRETRSVVRGFCDVFEDCSLWTGFGYEWMLLGTRGARGPVPEEQFTRQWRDPVVGGNLRALGLDSPALLGSTFLADATQLAEFTAGVPPLVDDHPYRVSPRPPPANAWREYRQLMEIEGARHRFGSSAFVRKLWPSAWLEKTLAAFQTQDLVARIDPKGDGLTQRRNLEAQQDAILNGGGALALWSLGSSFEQQAVAARVRATGSQEPEISEVLGLGALAEHHYREAESLLARAEPYAPHAARLRRWRILALALAGDREGAARLLAEAGPLRGVRGDDDAEAWRWLATRLGSPSPTP